MSQINQQAAQQPPYRGGGPYPHSCQLCQNLVIDTRKLSWLQRMRLRYYWLDFLKTAILIPIGMTITEVDNSSNSCLLLENIMTQINKFNHLPGDRPPLERP